MPHASAARPRIPHLPATVGRLFAVVACVAALALGGRVATLGGRVATLGGRVAALATAADAAPLACAPGLSPASCAPPGAVAGLFALGAPLPAGLAVERVADPARLGLVPPAPGHFYARVHGDLLLLAEGSRRVVAAVARLGLR